MFAEQIDTETTYVLRIRISETDRQVLTQDLRRLKDSYVSDFTNQLIHEIIEASKPAE